MHVVVMPISTHTWVVPTKLQVLLGAVQKLPKLVQQGWPTPPQAPHEPLAHMLPAMVPQTCPAAAQRLIGPPPDERMQQPPAAQVLLGQQG
jgi:hypothetical protein